MSKTYDVNVTECEANNGDFEMFVSQFKLGETVATPQGEATIIEISAEWKKAVIRFEARPARQDGFTVKSYWFDEIFPNHD
jgi:hypothetical protein